jgi:hypothetical protein
MAGTHVVTSRERVNAEGYDNIVEVVTTTWVGDAADGTVPVLSLRLDGFLHKVVTVPTDRAEVTSITCVADAAGSLNNKYFTINSALDATAFYVWMNVNSAGVDPAPGGTGIEVALATGATAAQVATAVAAAIDAQAAFVSTALSTTVTVTNATAGNTTDAADVDTGFTITVTTQGTAPTANYDITITDPSDSALDAAASDLLNRSATAPEQVYPAVTNALTPILLAGTYGLTVANNSATSATAQIILHLSDEA